MKTTELHVVTRDLDVDQRFKLGGTEVAASAAELNILDGATLSTAELNILDGVTASAAEISTLASSGITNADLVKLHAITASAAEVNKLDAITGYPVEAHEVTFTETTGAGTYTGSVSVPAGATIIDIIISGVALWDTATSATMKVGDVANDAGYYTGIDLKATDLLAGESLSFALAGGKAGAYIANSQVSPRYSGSARVISGIITAVGASGSAGRTRMVVIFALPTASAATKA
jgi:hypothetical protein